MLVRGFVRYVNTGAPVPDGTEVQFRREVDDSLISTVVTVGGMYEYEQHGSPGPYKVRAAIDDEVHITSSMVVGMSGPVDIGGLPLYFRLWEDGYISGVLDHLEAFSSGAAMQVSVRAGAAIIKGVLYDQGGVMNLAVDAADAQPRIDTVVVEVMLPGSGRTVEGRSRLVVKKGTPAASPVAPSLTQTTTIWEHPLGDIRVDPGVSTIASNKVTNRSGRAVTFIGPRQITTTMIALKAIQEGNIDDKTIKGAQIADDTITEGLLAPAVRTKLNASSRMIEDQVAFAAWGERSSVNYAQIADMSITLTEGTWKVETSADFQVFGMGAAGTVPGTFAAKLRNEGADILNRNYRSNPQSYSTIYISETVEYTVAAGNTWQVDADLRVAHVEDQPSTTNFRNGFLYMKAWRV